MKISDKQFERAVQKLMKKNGLSEFDREGIRVVQNDFGIMYNNTQSFSGFITLQPDAMTHLREMTGQTGTPEKEEVTGVTLELDMEEAAAILNHGHYCIEGSAMKAIGDELRGKGVSTYFPTSQKKYK